MHLHQATLNDDNLSPRYSTGLRESDHPGRSCQPGCRCDEGRYLRVCQLAVALLKGFTDLLQSHEPVLVQNKVEEGDCVSIEAGLLANGLDDIPLLLWRDDWVVQEALDIR